MRRLMFIVSCECKKGRGRVIMWCSGKEGLVIMTGKSERGVQSARVLTVVSDGRYFEGGISSVYFWDVDDGFAGCVLLKKCASPLLPNPF